MRRIKKSDFGNEFFLVPRNFFIIYDFKNGCKMNLRIIMINHAAYPEIRFLTKSISKPYGRASTMPPAWELKEFLHQF